MSSFWEHSGGRTMFYDIFSPGITLKFTFTNFTFHDAMIINSQHLFFPLVMFKIKDWRHEWILSHLNVIFLWIIENVNRFILISYLLFPPLKVLSSAGIAKWCTKKYFQFRIFKVPYTPSRVNSLQEFKVVLTCKIYLY